MLELINSDYNVFVCRKQYRLSRNFSIILSEKLTFFSFSYGKNLQHYTVFVTPIKVCCACL